MYQNPIFFYYKTRSKAFEKILKGWPIGSLGSNVFLAAKNEIRIFSLSLNAKANTLFLVPIIVLLGTKVNLFFKETSEFVG